MCEYCGCQQVATIDELTREHDLVVNMMGTVRAAHAAGDVPGMAVLARRIAEVLRPHTEVEEQGLFPAMAADFPDQIDGLLSEHRQVEAVLGAAASAVPSDPAWPDELIKVLDVLRDHILKEQDGVFPAALTTLRTDDWEAIEAVRARSARCCRPNRPQPAGEPPSRRWTPDRY